MARCRIADSEASGLLAMGYGLQAYWRWAMSFLEFHTMDSMLRGVAVGSFTMPFMPQLFHITYVDLYYQILSSH